MLAIKESRDMDASTQRIVLSCPHAPTRPMPRPARPFRNEPRPTPPDPIHYINNSQGLMVARCAYKKRYDAWFQRRRRAIARGECVVVDDHLRSETTNMPAHTAPTPAQPSDPQSPEHQHALVPVERPADAPAPNMMLMIPASMVSLLTRPVAFP